MKRFLVPFITAFALIASSTAFAATPAMPTGMIAVPLAFITNDRDSSVSHIELMLNAAGIVRGIYLRTSASAKSDPAYASGQMYSLAAIESKSGVVVGKGQGVKAIFLKGTIAPQAGRGVLVIKYLHNGIFRSYHECRISLRRVARGDWQLVNAYTGHPVKHIKVKTWALGISTIVNVCPTRGR